MPNLTSRLAIAFLETTADVEFIQSIYINESPNNLNIVAVTAEVAYACQRNGLRCDSADALVDFSQYLHRRSADACFYEMDQFCERLNDCLDREYPGVIRDERFDSIFYFVPLKSLIDSLVYRAQLFSRSFEKYGKPEVIFLSEESGNGRALQMALYRKLTQIDDDALTVVLGDHHCKVIRIRGGETQSFDSFRWLRAIGTVARRVRLERWRIGNTLMRLRATKEALRIGVIDDGQTYADYRSLSRAWRDGGEYVVNFRRLRAVIQLARPKKQFAMGPPKDLGALFAEEDPWTNAFQADTFDLREIYSRHIGKWIQEELPAWRSMALSWKGALEKTKIKVIFFSALTIPVDSAALAGAKALGIRTVSCQHGGELGRALKMYRYMDYHTVDYRVSFEHACVPYHEKLYRLKSPARWKTPKAIPLPLFADVSPRQKRENVKKRQNLYPKSSSSRFQSHDWSHRGHVHSTHTDASNGRHGSAVTTHLGNTLLYITTTLSYQRFSYIGNNKFPEHWYCQLHEDIVNLFSNQKSWTLWYKEYPYNRDPVADAIRKANSATSIVIPGLTPIEDVVDKVDVIAIDFLSTAMMPISVGAKGRPVIALYQEQWVPIHSDVLRLLENSITICRKQSDFVGLIGRIVNGETLTLRSPGVEYRKAFLGWPNGQPVPLHIIAKQLSDVVLAS